MKKKRRPRFIHSSWIPRWANDDEKISRLVRAVITRYIQLGDIPETVPLETLRAACDWRTAGYALKAPFCKSEKHRQIWAAHVETARHHGGYFNVVARVAEKYWRAAADAEGVQVAQELGITTGEVREIVARLTRAAREQNLPTWQAKPYNRYPCRRVSSNGSKNRGAGTSDPLKAAWSYSQNKSEQPPPELTPEMVKECVAWRAQGWRFVRSWPTGQKLLNATRKVELAQKILARLDGVSVAA